jgi:restriction system protein
MGVMLMAIPDFQKIMLSFLKFLGDRQEHSIGETVDNLADQFDLSDKERRELLPSGPKSKKLIWTISLKIKKAYHGINLIGNSEEPKICKRE